MFQRTKATVNHASDRPPKSASLIPTGIPGVPSHGFIPRFQPPMHSTHLVPTHREQPSTTYPTPCGLTPRRPTPPRHSAQDPISPRTDHLLNIVQPSTMRHLVDIGVMRYRFALEPRGSLQLYLGGEGVSRSHFIEPSLERALAVATAIDPNCPPTRPPVKGEPSIRDAAVHFEATRTQPTLGTLLEPRRSFLLPMRLATTPHTEQRAKPSPTLVRWHVS